MILSICLCIIRPYHFSDRNIGQYSLGQVCLSSLVNLMEHWTKERKILLLGFFFPGQDCFRYHCREFINCGASESSSSKGRWGGRSPGGVLPCLAVTAVPHSSPLPAHSSIPNPELPIPSYSRKCSVSIARKRSGSGRVCPAVHRPAGHSGVWGSALQQFCCLLLQTFSLDEALDELYCT